jgi:pantetheine-phosphate adenylyltransferase
MGHDVKFDEEIHLPYTRALITLNIYGIDMTKEELIRRWSEPHRHFHTLDHLNDVLRKIYTLYKNQKTKLRELHSLIIAAVFHDIIYDPKRTDNEEKSAALLEERRPKEKSLKLSSLNSDLIIQTAKKIILDTKTHSAKSGIEKIFNDIDCSVMDGDLSELLDWEKKIYKEYSYVGFEKYKKSRIEFLENVIAKGHKNKQNLIDLIEYIKFPF